MKRPPLQIGKRTFNTKKDALAHYRAILNSYDFWETLNDEHFEELCALYEFRNGVGSLAEFNVAYIDVIELQYNTKGFAFIDNDDMYCLVSYIQCIKGAPSALTQFSQACRRAIQDDLRLVKLAYFQNHSKGGKSKCMESGEWCRWELLNTDHRQPNTFSVIVDRFIELHQIDVAVLEYNGCEDGGFELADKELAEKFRFYHSGKANLRIVKKEKNLGRSHLAKIGTMKKDLRIE